jgi:hypothetical protein
VQCSQRNTAHVRREAPHDTHHGTPCLCSRSSDDHMCHLLSSRALLQTSYGERRTAEYSRRARRTHPAVLTHGTAYSKVEHRCSHDYVACPCTASSSPCLSDSDTFHRSYRHSAGCAHLDDPPIPSYRAVVGSCCHHSSWPPYLSYGAHFPAQLIGASVLIIVKQVCSVASTRSSRSTSAQRQ